MKLQCIKDKKKHFTPCCMKNASWDNKVIRSLSCVWVTATDTWFSLVLSAPVALMSLILPWFRGAWMILSVSQIFGLLEAKPNHRFQSDSKVKGELYRISSVFFIEKSSEAWRANCFERGVLRRSFYYSLYLIHLNSG